MPRPGYSRSRTSPSFGATVSLLALGTLSACGDVSSGTGDAAPATVGSSFAQGGGSESATPILTLMQGVLDTTPFRGVRRTMERQDGVLLEQLEDVGADGTGSFAIELLEVISLPPDVDSLSYDILFESSARFQWTMRDFQIRDASLAASNYFVQLLTDAPVVAGIDCVRLSLLRQEEIGGRPGQYQVDVDPNTGFVLAWREFSNSGQVLADVAYESFEYGGDVSDMTLRGRQFAAAPLDVAMPLSGQINFAPRFPDLLPGNMQVVSAEVQTVPDSIAAAVSPGASSYLPTGEWLRMVATDGVEALAFAHSSLSAAGTARQLGELRMIERGSWEIGFGRLDGTMFVVAARATMAEIEQIVGSAF